MSLARSASGPSGLTINTGAANSLSTSTSQPATSGGLFGSAAPAPGTSGTTTSASTTTTTTAPASGTGMSLFGGGGAAPKTGGGLFGTGIGASNTQQQSQGTQGGGLFGGAPAATLNTNVQQPAAAAGGSGLFGGGGGGSVFGQKPATPGAGLFGGAGAGGQAQQQTNAAPSLSQPQQGQAAPSSGLFGSSTAANTQANTQPSFQIGAAFGLPQAKPGPAFGQPVQPPPPQPQVSAVQINYDNLRPRSRFDDLAKPVQDEIALIDKGIARVIKMKDEIGEFMPQHERDIEQLGRDVNFVESKFRTVQVALNRDIQTVKALQDLTKKNITDAQLSFKATDNLKLPTHYHQTGLFSTQSSSGGTSGPSGGGAASASTTHGDAQDLITYFNRICDDVEKYKKRLDEYRGEIERDMPGVENGLYEQIRALRERHHGGGGGNGDSMSDQLGQVLLALREMGTAIVNQAGQIADTRERLSRLQVGFVEGGIYGAGMAG